MTFAENTMVREKLQGSDMFTCDRWDCRMSKSDCVKRQEKRVETVKNYWGTNTQSAFPECQGCIQGMRNRMEKMMVEM